MKRYLVIIAAILALAALVPACGPGPAETGSPRAAIIDQLYLMEPNPAIITEATAIMTSAGFTVDLWQGENITVDFYRQLPQRGYKFILLRAHSGTLMSLEGEKVTQLGTTYLFTGEKYTPTKYAAEQLTDKVSNAMMSDKYPLVFAVNSEFVAKDTKGSFANTVILAMGCESYYMDDMAAAFRQKGASTYIGWNTVVTLEHTDKATLDLLLNLCREKMTVAQAVARTMDNVGPDPYFETYLKYLSSDGDRGLQELIK